MKSSSNRRSWKNMLINKQIQIRIMIINLLSMLVVVLINTAIMLSSSLCNIYYPDDSIWWQAIDLYALSSESLIFSMAAVFIIAVVSQMFISHKICGPLVNFTNSFRRMAKGDLTRKVRLRKNDLLTSEANQFNEMLSQLSVHIEVLKKDNQQLVQALRELADNGNDPSGLENARRLLQDHEDSFNRNLRNFKLADEVEEVIN
jgi:methyl-accepting chemotaxis protein